MEKEETNNDDFEWDGRAPFYPNEGYEQDAIDQQRFRDFCRKEGLEETKEQTSSEASSEVEESSDSGEEMADCLARKTIYNPPLFDTNNGYYHPLFAKDHLFKTFVMCDGQIRSESLAAGLSRVMKSKDQEPFGRLMIAKKSEERIHSNRKDANLLVKGRLQCVLVLKAHIIGLPSDVAPERELQVPGDLPLSAFHDRVLCPAFGWTRGYHDYVFVVHPSGYKNGPPANPMNDVVFGSVCKGPSIVGNRGLYGTIRTSQDPLRVDDSFVCLADLIQNPGHDFYHVLASSGWKTRIVLTEVIPTKDGKDRPRLIGGRGESMPESNGFDLDLSTSYVVEEFSCAGPHAYALGREMLRLARLEPEKNRWMLEHGQSGITSVSPQDATLLKAFNLKTTDKALRKAWQGDAIPNPEHSTDWMHCLVGRPGPSMMERLLRGPRSGACQKCGKPEERMPDGTKLKTCSRCRDVFYCSKDCQATDWKKHKKVCRPKS